MNPTDVIQPVQPAQPVQPVIEGGVLDAVRDWLGRYICTVVDTDLDLLTLWAAHTYLVMETYTSPRLLIDSPVPESGKTTCIEHLERLCLKPVQCATLSSPALISRMLHKEMRTILIDEADRSLSPDKPDIGDLMAVLNSGYKRGATRPVLVQKGNDWDTVEMPTFAPVVMAGNSPNLPEDTQSRIIRVLLMPDLDGLAEESDWELINEEAEALGALLAEWTDQVRDQVRLDRPGLPEGIVGRFREKWSPLKRVAAAYGGRWPAAVDAMALHDREQLVMDKEDGLVRTRPHILLLTHLFEQWEDSETFIPTAKLLNRLADAHPAMWGAQSPQGKPITAQGMGRMLARNYKVNSSRPGGVGPRGYLRSDLSSVWGRMRVTPPVKPVGPVEPVEPVGIEPAPQLPTDISGDFPPVVCDHVLTLPIEQARGTCGPCDLRDRRAS